MASKELGGSGGLAGDPAARGSMRLVKEKSDRQSVTFEGTVGTAQVTKKYSVGKRPFEPRAGDPGDRAHQGDLFLVYPGYVRPDAPKPQCALARRAASRRRR